MNILLWVLQILLAFWNITGGIFTLSNYESLKSAWANDLPGLVWGIICILQIVFALSLILPGVIKALPKKLIPISAIYLAINALAGCLLFSKYAGFPGLLWGVVPAVISGFVAYSRKMPKSS
jgi:hypothetical protein